MNCLEQFYNNKLQGHFSDQTLVTTKNLLEYMGSHPLEMGGFSKLLCTQSHIILAPCPASRLNVQCVQQGGNSGLEFLHVICHLDFLFLPTLLFINKMCGKYDNVNKSSNKVAIHTDIL